eukprot:CAMPEP_0113446838 /NCGR_PEP_ID=MMETSP0014_2-20120614/3925_1 /TAXON_ID=2857 /ORGANISM="Nitzschia sp." /LENGTH=1707 /DNA_ID=CAMNT_0000337967 /DNA_START=24 /DNA_END=5147 /DNA_ORIENTATION=+ /assembly_acc=CAM_ASM_000159
MVKYKNFGVGVGNATGGTAGFSPGADAVVDDTTGAAYGRDTANTNNSTSGRSYQSSGTNGDETFSTGASEYSAQSDYQQQRKSKKLAYVGYVPMNTNSNSNTVSRSGRSSSHHVQNVDPATVGIRDEPEDVVVDPAATPTAGNNSRSKSIHATGATNLSSVRMDDNASSSPEEARQDHQQDSRSVTTRELLDYSVAGGAESVATRELLDYPVPDPSAAATTTGGGEKQNNHHGFATAAGDVDPAAADAQQQQAGIYQPTGDIVAQSRLLRRHRLAKHTHTLTVETGNEDDNANNMHDHHKHYPGGRDTRSVSSDEAISDAELHGNSGTNNRIASPRKSAKDRQQDTLSPSAKSPYRQQHDAITSPYHQRYQQQVQPPSTSHAENTGGQADQTRKASPFRPRSERLARVLRQKPDSYYDRPLGEQQQYDDGAGDESYYAESATYLVGMSPKKRRDHRPDFGLSGMDGVASPSSSPRKMRQQQQQQQQPPAYHSSPHVRYPSSNDQQQGHPDGIVPPALDQYDSRRFSGPTSPSKTRRSFFPTAENEQNHGERYVQSLHQQHIHNHGYSQSSQPVRYQQPREQGPPANVNVPSNQNTYSPSPSDIDSAMIDEWTVNEDNQALWMCGPDGQQFIADSEMMQHARNFNPRKSCNGVKKSMQSSCAPMGDKVQSMVGSVMNAIGAMQAGYRHTDSDRRQFDEIVEESVFDNNMHDGTDRDQSFHQRTKMIGPHWKSKDGKKDKSKDAKRRSVEDCDNDLLDPFSGDFLAGIQKFAKDSAKNPMALLGMQQQDLSKGVPGGLNGSSVVNDVKNLFDTFQKYYEPEEMLYEEQYQQPNSMARAPNVPVQGHQHGQPGYPYSPPQPLPQQLPQPGHHHVPAHPFFASSGLMAEYQYQTASPAMHQYHAYGQGYPPEPETALSTEAMKSISPTSTNHQDEDCISEIDEENEAKMDLSKESDFEDGKDESAVAADRKAEFNSARRKEMLVGLRMSGRRFGPRSSRDASSIDSGFGVPEKTNDNIAPPRIVNETHAMDSSSGDEFIAKSFEKNESECTGSTPTNETDQDLTNKIDGSGSLKSTNLESNDTEEKDRMESPSNQSSQPPFANEFEGFADAEEETVTETKEVQFTQEMKTNFMNIEADDASVSQRSFITAMCVDLGIDSQNTSGTESATDESKYEPSAIRKSGSSHSLPIDETTEEIQTSEEDRIDEVHNIDDLDGMNVVSREQDDSRLQQPVISMNCSSGLAESLEGSDDDYEEAGQQEEDLIMHSSGSGDANSPVRVAFSASGSVEEQEVGDVGGIDSVDSSTESNEDVIAPDLSTDDHGSTDELVEGSGPNLLAFDHREFHFTQLDVIEEECSSEGSESGIVDDEFDDKHDDEHADNGRINISFDCENETTGIITDIANNGPQAEKRHMKSLRVVSRALKAFVIYAVVLSVGINYGPIVREHGSVILERGMTEASHLYEQRHQIMQDGLSRLDGASMSASRVWNERGGPALHEIKGRLSDSVEQGGAALNMMKDHLSDRVGQGGVALNKVKDTLSEKAGQGGVALNEMKDRLSDTVADTVEYISEQVDSFELDSFVPNIRVPEALGDMRAKDVMKRVNDMLEQLLSQEYWEETPFDEPSISVSSRDEAVNTRRQVSPLLEVDDDIDTKETTTSPKIHTIAEEDEPLAESEEHLGEFGQHDDGMTNDFTSDFGEDDFTSVYGEEIEDGW